jgi:hypothetical protein
MRLRGHHLICLHFFRGEGYDPDFVRNLARIMEKAKAGEPVEISAGPDDVCLLCPHLKGRKCAYRKDAEDEIKAMDRTALAFLRVKPGELVQWQAIEDQIPAIFGEWAAEYCSDCDWRKVCAKEEKFLRLRNG